jgi:rRNA maturation protein Nop10
MSDSTPNLPSSPATMTPDEQRWPAWMTFATVGILPATTARRTEQVSLGAAYVVHFLGALGIIIVCFFWGAWAGLHGSATMIDIMIEMLDFLDTVVREVARHPVEGILISVACVVGAEVGYVLGALLCAPWGADHEPFRASIRNAIHRAWLHTPHIVLVLLLGGGPAVYLMRAADEAGSTSWRQAEAKMQRTHGRTIDYGGKEWNKAFQRRMSRHPFYVRCGYEIGTVLCFAGGAWWLWSLLRFIGTPRRLSPVARPPTCENCGYNLTGITLDGRCPECGESAVLSLGPDVRAATPWQRHRPLGRWRALLRCSAEAGRRPASFGRQLPLSAQRGDHRWVLASRLPVLFFIGWAGIIACYIADTGRWPLGEDFPVLWAVGPVVGYFASVGGVTVALLAAGLVGLVYRVKTGRNLLAGAMQAACYSAGYLVLWVIMTFILAAAAFVAEDYTRRLSMPRYERGLLIYGLLVFLPNILGLAGYVWLIARITAGTRYANR